MENCKKNSKIFQTKYNIKDGPATAQGWNFEALNIFYYIEHIFLYSFNLYQKKFIIFFLHERFNK